MGDQKDLSPLDTPPLPTSPSAGAAFKEKMEKVFADVYSQEDPELPLLPERHRMFAFRWATEFRGTQEWANLFHVTSATIIEWKKNPKIVKYYMIIRRKQNMVLMERMKILEAKAFQKLYELLDMPVTDKNADVVRKTIMNVLGVDVDGALNLRVTAEAVAGTKSESGEERAVAKVEASVDLKRLRERIDEMELLEDMVNVTPDEEVQDVQGRREESTGEEAV